MDLANILSWLGKNQDHLWTALAGIGGFGTLLVAHQALQSWQKEKQYDLTIENLALCNSAVQFIKNLRSPISIDDEIVNKDYKQKLLEISQEMKNLSVMRAAKSMYIYQSRKDKHSAAFEQFLKLREKDWATYGPNHDFYQFYNWIINLDNKIRVAHINHYFINGDRENLTDEEYRINIKSCRSIIYELSQDDEINKELDNWVRIMQIYRKPFKV